MADTKKRKAEIAEVRDYLSDAYAFVRSSIYTRAAANTTYEQLLDSAIDKIEGTADAKSGRPSKKDKIIAVRNNLTEAIKTLQDTNPEDWEWGSDQQVQDKDKANTPETPQQGVA